MTALNIHAGGHTNYLEMLKTRLEMLIRKINKEPHLSPSEKSEARQEAIKSVQKDKKESFKNCY